MHDGLLTLEVPVSVQVQSSITYAVNIVKKLGKASKDFGSEINIEEMKCVISLHQNAGQNYKNYKKNRA